MNLLRVGAEQFRRQLSELLSRVGYGGERVLVEKNGTPLAVLIPYELYQEVIEQTASSTGGAGEALQSLRQKLMAADIPYEDLADGLVQERLQTLKEHYPDYYEEFVKERGNAASEPA